MKNTSVVVSTYHKNFEGNNKKTILDYKNQNFDNFSILFDDHFGISEDAVSEIYEGAKVHIYNDEFFEKHNFNRPISKFHFWGSHQNPKYFYAHFRMLTFYIKCPNFEYYWFFDDDVIFEGDLKSMLEKYSVIKDDYLGIQIFKKEDYKDFPNVSVINDRMRGSKGNWLDFCPGHGDNFKSTEIHMGSFYPIVRFSNRALSYLLGLNVLGYYGYSEGFVPTSLASAGFSVSSILNEFNEFLIECKECTLRHKGMEFTWEWL